MFTFRLEALLDIGWCSVFDPMRMSVVGYGFCF